MLQYDPATLTRTVEQLNAEARVLERTYALMGVFFGCLGAAVTARLVAPELLLAAALIGALMGGPLAYSMARSRAFTMRVQAQTLLVQMQIERNTRGGMDDALKLYEHPRSTG
ncbi:MAG: hypothetical protein H6739_27780 [Alphaproteobacteria bacterium]|nr:hypothetical protein [Alphaproteobacteria bacterium]